MDPNEVTLEDVQSWLQNPSMIPSNYLKIDDIEPTELYNKEHTEYQGYDIKITKDGIQIGSVKYRGNIPIKSINTHDLFSLPNIPEPRYIFPDFTSPYFQLRSTKINAFIKFSIDNKTVTVIPIVMDEITGSLFIHGNVKRFNIEGDKVSHKWVFYDRGIVRECEYMSHEGFFTKVEYDELGYMNYYRCSSGKSKWEYSHLDRAQLNGVITLEKNKMNLVNGIISIPYKNKTFDVQLHKYDSITRIVKIFSNIDDIKYFIGPHYHNEYCYNTENKIEGPCFSDDTCKGIYCKRDDITVNLSFEEYYQIFIDEFNEIYKYFDIKPIVTIILGYSRYYKFKEYLISKIGYLGQYKDLVLRMIALL